ncbi:MAG: lipoate--protein ligase family protein [Deltaproteobacteria bacterium]|nr:lipoate--protein ligase family protein [Deltaproteobacteria bacterium]
MNRWRLLDTPAMSAAENMALDDTLLELKGKGASPDTIRFLQFSPRAVLVGFHQSVAEEIRVEYCRANNIEINRRVTGGGAIFFDESQLGWEVICSKGFFDVTIPNNALFRTLCAPVITGLQSFGIRSAFRPRNDIEIRGRKISGTGGTESDGAFLFQGTMLTDFDVDTMLRSLRIPVEKLKAKEIDSVKERVTCLKWELGYTPALEEIKEAIKRGFEKHLSIRLEPAGLTRGEERLFEKKLEYYRSEEWIDMVRPRFQRRESVQSAYKSDAGMVRFTLVVNPVQGVLKEAYITGDILSFPTDALLHLEARLKGIPLDRDRIHGIIRGFFEQGRIHVPGMSCDDFLKPLDQALSKIEISKAGIPLEHCNLISVTNGTFEEVLRERPSVLLLPYCAKLTDCDMRYEKGCDLCGACSVGDAWTVGLDREMMVVSIVSFEDLWDELERMKRAGVRAFVGCCCQPFFTKHVDDFEKAGIPGILLDIDDTTCYDLDQAKEAYAGKFANQTRVNLDLLDAVLSVGLR